MQDLTIQMDKVFSAEQIQQMVTLMEERDAVTRIHDEVIVPHMAEINRITGQENDPMYWAYASVYALDVVFNPSAASLGMTSH